MKKLSLALLLGLGSAMAQAATVTYSFTGKFDNLTRTEPAPGYTVDEPLFLGLVQAGDIFSGTFTFDTAAESLGVVEGPPFNTAAYPSLGLNLWASGAFNAALPSWNPTQIYVSDNQTWPDGVLRDNLTTGAGALLDDGHYLGFRLSANAWKASDFSAYRIPYGYDGLIDGEFSLYLSHGHAGADDWARGSLQIRLIDPPPELAPVPEPATGLLLLAGLGALVPLRRRAANA